MAIVPIDLTLASAVLAGGARLASSGGGLPQRVTTEQDHFLDQNILLGGSASTFQGIQFPSDGTMDILGIMANSTVKRFTGSGTSWSQSYSTGASNGRSILRSAANTSVIGRELAGATTFLELAEGTGVVSSKTFGPAATQKQVFVVPGGTADRAWYHAGTALLSEIVYSTGAATGRTITPTTGCLVAVGSNWDGTASIYILEAGTRITRYNESTLALMTTWTTAPGSDLGPPGSSFGNAGLIVQADGRVIVRNDSPYCFERLPATGGTDMHADSGVERVIWGSTELGGPVRTNLSGGAQFEPGFDISPNGRWFAWIASSAASVVFRGVVVRNIQTQTAEWTYTLAGEVALTDFNLPGNLGNHYGIHAPFYNGHASVAYDYRNARVYYQRVGLDGSVVYLPHGAYVPPGGLSLVGASAIKIGVEFDRGLGKVVTATGPYIGGPTGEGPRLYLDSGVNVRRGRVLGGM
jgi:hypothetical protein